VYDSPNYPVTAEEAEAFVQEMRAGTLIAVAPAGYPQVSILPFVKEGDVIDLHCVQEDPTFAAVRANPRVTFFVSDYLGFSPHDWVRADDAGRATLHFRAVTYECDATVSTEPAEVARTLEALVTHHEPGKTWERVADGDFYGPRLRRLAALRLTVVKMQAKFKLGPAGDAALKLDVARHMRERGESNDARAAAEIERWMRR
jgi:transcriptional regulator